MGGSFGHSMATETPGSGTHPEEQQRMLVQDYTKEHKATEKGRLCRSTAALLQEEILNCKGFRMCPDGTLPKHPAVLLISDR